jgi:hypothetical protein
MYPLRVAISPKVSISICPTPGIFVWLCGGMENQGSRYEDSSFRLGPFVFSLALSVGLFPVLVNGPKDPSQLSDSRPRRLATGGGSRKVNRGNCTILLASNIAGFFARQFEKPSAWQRCLGRRQSFWRREIEIYSALCHQVRGWSSSSRGPSRQRKDHSAGACFLNSS